MFVICVCIGACNRGGAATVPGGVQQAVRTEGQPAAAAAADDAAATAAADDAAATDAEPQPDGPAEYPEYLRSRDPTAGPSQPTDGDATAAVRQPAVRKQLAVQPATANRP